MNLKIIYIILVSLTVNSQVLIPMAFWSVPWIKNFGTYRAWLDGTYAISCNGYKNSGTEKKYAGAIGNGVYRIQPISFGAPFDVYCDMTNDAGGWMLAAVPRRAVAKMSETAGLLDPTLTAAARNSNIWSTTSTVPFRNIRFSDNWPTPTNRNIATFAADQTFQGLMTTYSAYAQTSVVANGINITTTIASTCFIIRGKSGNNAPYTDAIDWLWMGFHSACTTPFNLADTWDTTAGSTQWVVGGKDDKDGMAIDTSVGINSGNRHWNFTNTATYDVDTRTIVWVQ